MTGKKVWVISGLLYLGVVIAGYSVITGTNPLESGGNHGEHGEVENVDHLEQDDH